MIGGVGLLQDKITEWARRAFGDTAVDSIPERGARVLEEAMELAQAAGVTREMALKTVEAMYRQPKGEVAQEIGGVGVTLMIMCSIAGLSFDRTIGAEIDRVLAKPIQHFWDRHKRKAALGLITNYDGHGGAPAPEETDDHEEPPLTPV